MNCSTQNRRLPGNELLDQKSNEHNESPDDDSDDILAILIQPREWRGVIRFISNVILFFYIALEVVVRIYEERFNITGIERAFAILRPPPMKHHPKQRKYRDLKNDIMGPLNGWLKGLIIRTADDFPYDQPSDLFEFFIRGSKMRAHARLCSRIVLRDRAWERTMKTAQKSIEAIRKRADVSDKLTLLYHHLLPFLADLARVEPKSLSHFVNILAEDMAIRPLESFHIFIHQRLRDENVPMEVYESTMAIMSLFIQEGASVWRFRGDRIWMKPDREHHAVLTLLMFAAVERCSSRSAYKADAPRNRTITRILKADPEVSFQRVRSQTSNVDDTLFRDHIMWDVTLNCCNEFVEGEWPLWLLDRAVWALEFGREYMSEESLRQLISQKDVPGNDFSSFSALTLLSFSITGIIRFRGKHENIYNLTAYPDAKFVTHGLLPQPTVKDLITLGLVKQLRPNKFIATHIPGLQSGFAAVHHNNQLFFEIQEKNTPFHTTLTQKIG